MKKTKLFRFDDVFDFKRGRRLIELDQIEGEVAYISSTKENNGISAYITPPDFMTTYSNKMTITNSGSVGYVFYHEYDFVASDHCTVFWIKDQSVKFDRSIFMYIKPIIEALRPKYNFGRELKNPRLAGEQILLPVDESSKVDWDYMRTYIEERVSSISFNSIYNQGDHAIDFDVSEWKEFTINEVFPRVESGKISHAALLPEGSDIPYIGAKKEDCGVIKFVSELAEDNNGPCLAFICDGDGSVGYTNYIPFKKFTATTNVRLGYNEKLNLRNGLFLVSVLDLQRQKYSFGRKWGRRLKDSTVKLPQDGDGNPNWEYMEHFIRSTGYANWL